MLAITFIKCRLTHAAGIVFLGLILPAGVFGQTTAVDSYNRGLIKKQKGDLEGAIADFSRAIELDPKYSQAYSARGSAKLWKNDPEMAKVNYQRYAKSKEGDLDGAIADFNRAVELDSKNVNAYLGRGIARRQKGDLEGAIADNDRAIELDPKNDSAYNNRANIRAFKGDLDGALSDYNRAVEIDPKNACAHNNRGHFKMNRRDLDGAIADFNRAIELDVKYALAYCYRGKAKSKKDDFEKAIADFNHAIELDPQYTLAYCMRGYAKSDKGDADGAIADFDRAIGFDREYAAAYSGRGYAKTLMGEADGAIADCNRAIELEPQLDMAYVHRGYAHFLNREWTKSLDDFQRYYKLTAESPEDPFLVIWLARARLGEKEEADKELSERLEKHEKAEPGDWISRIAGLLLEKNTEAGFLAAAASPNPDKERSQRCEAWYYAGMKRLLAGKRASAANRFHKCLATEKKTSLAYQFALAELKTLVILPDWMSAITAFLLALLIHAVVLGGPFFLLLLITKNRDQG
jgi:tetratricopeptide (TPR) repeat protein